MEGAGVRLRQGWGSRGIAWWQGRIYTGTQDGRLIAVDARIGKQLWRFWTVPGDPAKGKSPRQSAEVAGPFR